MELGMLMENFMARIPVLVFERYDATGEASSSFSEEKEPKRLLLFWAAGG
jgi:hypothetical protein